MRIQAIRHATMRVTCRGNVFLVDPILSPKGTMAAIAGVPNTNGNPLVDLPMPIGEILDVDAVLVTHTHRDHFDDAAARLLPKSLPIFCQPQDADKLTGLGFARVIPVAGSVEWNGVTISRTDGRHGHGELAEQMAPVSGYILAAQDEPTLYITGDTVFCMEVERALADYDPDAVACFCGAAQFGHGEPITMDAADVLRVCERAPKAQVIAVHMEAWNHCRLTRAALHEAARARNLAVIIPEDGELIEL